ncbi:hypothetical protein lerEdw1_004464 [Lerista edwardsae]|nr:hypothetical protein lerEdw1_004464 [Lerista edwardsae]
MAIMLRSQIVVFVLLLGFLGNWFAFLGVSIRNAGRSSMSVLCKPPLSNRQLSLSPRKPLGERNGLALNLYVPPWMISSQLANRKSLDPVESRLSIYDSAFSLQTPAESRTTFTLLYHFSEAFLC